MRFSFLVVGTFKGNLVACMNPASYVLLDDVSKVYRSNVGFPFLLRILFPCLYFAKSCAHQSGVQGMPIVP